MHAARELLDEYTATVILAGRFSRSHRTSRDKELEVLERATNAELDMMLPASRARLRCLRDELGARRSSKEYQAILGSGTIGPTEFGYLPRWLLEECFARIAEGIPTISKLPYHGLVQLDVNGLLDDLPSRREYRILEASLYEDMAISLNRIMDLEASLSQGGPIASTADKKLPRKEIATARRSTISSAFYFVEAYLNSLAFDTLVLRADSLKDIDRTRLTEWDQVRQKPKFLSLRDKCIHYPRLRIGDEHPIIDENRSENLRYFLSEFKELRDAIVHASAVANPGSLSLTKEHRFLTIDTPACGKVVDVAIALVRELEQAIFGTQNRLFWLMDRELGGSFPTTAFA